MTISQQVIGALIGLIIGTLLGNEISRFLYRPKVFIKFKQISPLFTKDGYFWSIIVANLGRTVATDCIGTITIDGLSKEDIMESHEAVMDESLPTYSEERIDLDYPRSQLVSPMSFREIRNVSLCWSLLGNPFKIDRHLLESFTMSLLFTLTAAQKKVTGEILSDLSRPTAMSRLLQGDVGSGKTVVATIALLQAVANGFQGALMAPTEILAEQHFSTVSQLLARCGQYEEHNGLRTYSGLMQKPVTIALLTGAAATKNKRELQRCINDGEIDIIIGTHALIQENVTFKKLGLAVVDEQHRFGVEQRSAMRQKGYNPHILVMTATPIPRTLALTLYGDLDLSVIDSLPPGRQAIKTKWLKPEQRASAYNFIAKQVGEGRQAFIICPLIEESEAVQAKAATAEFEKLSKEIFPDLKLGLLHGRLPNNEKDRVMQSFRSGEYNILVATPVIEVGIDVPNATVMLVESADRFGLSQLHQFRGRVGRGPAQSYCMLLADDPSAIGRQRLDIIEHVQDGFVLAEEDLKLRGPGEFFGTRQSGLPDLRMAMLSDTKILETARREATVLFEKDPDLKQSENLLLRKELIRVWPKEKLGEWS